MLAQVASDATRVAADGEDVVIRGGIYSAYARDAIAEHLLAARDGEQGAGSSVMQRDEDASGDLSRMARALADVGHLPRDDVIESAELSPASPKLTPSFPPIAASVEVSNNSRGQPCTQKPRGGSGFSHQPSNPCSTLHASHAAVTAPSNDGRHPADVIHAADRGMTHAPNVSRQPGGRRWRPPRAVEAASILPLDIANTATPPPPEETGVQCWEVTTESECWGWGWDPLDWGWKEQCTWGNSLNNFDNLPNSMLTLFEMATTEGWMDIMNKVGRARGGDMSTELGYLSGSIIGLL